MTLPPLYFRLRENGAAVFRVVEDVRGGRLDLEPLAFANVRNGEIKPQGGRALTEEERAEIDGWIEARREAVAAQERDVALRAVEAMNAAAHWVQTKASDEDIAALAHKLHLAMHDLRGTLVRRQSDGRGRGDGT